MLVLEIIFGCCRLLHCQSHGPAKSWRRFGCAGIGQRMAEKRATHGQAGVPKHASTRSWELMAQQRFSAGRLVLLWNFTTRISKFSVPSPLVQNRFLLTLATFSLTVYNVLAPTEINLWAHSYGLSVNSFLVDVSLGLPSVQIRFLLTVDIRKKPVKIYLSSQLS